jgi:hypothetical protein
MFKRLTKGQCLAEAARYRTRASELSFEALGVKRGIARTAMFKAAVTYERLAEALEGEAAGRMS